MKIEKMNDHQIRCTLTREDLAMRQIKLSELAYGSEKTKLLFQDMMQQAANDFGFEAEDIPLMIEAIPLSPEKIVLIITKVESPDELDTRFSNFTHPEDEEDTDTDDEEDEEDDSDSEEIPSELLDLFNQIKADKAAAAKERASGPIEMIRHFSFRDLDEAIRTAHALDGYYRGKNSLYKDERAGLYHLIIHQSKHSISDFSRVNNTVSAHLKSEKFVPGMQEFFDEHFKTIISGNALQSLAEI